MIPRRIITDPNAHCSGREMCETIVKADFLRKNDDSIPTWEEIWKSHPRGELYEVMGWYHFALVVLEERKKSEESIKRDKILTDAMCEIHATLQGRIGTANKKDRGRLHEGALRHMKAEVEWAKGRCSIILQAENKKDVIALMWVASDRRNETHKLIMALSCRNYGWQPRKYIVWLEAKRRK